MKAKFITLRFILAVSKSKNSFDLIESYTFLDANHILVKGRALPIKMHSNEISTRKI